MIMMIFFVCVGKTQHGVFAEAMFPWAQFRKHWTTPAEQDQIVCQFIRKELALIQTLWYLTVLMQWIAISRKIPNHQMLAISRKQPLSPLLTQATDLALTHPLRRLRRWVTEQRQAVVITFQPWPQGVRQRHLSRVVTSPTRLSV